MAGFEIVVRPAVFPNIRPAPARLLPPADDPEKGFAVIRGNPAKMMSLSYSYSFNASSGNATETEREVDEARIYQQDDDGTIDRDNFIDVQVPTEIKNKGRSRDGASATMSTSEKEAQGRRPRLMERWIERFKRQEEQENIEILETDKRIKNPDAKSGESE